MRVEYVERSKEVGRSRERVDVRGARRREGGRGSE